MKCAALTTRTSWFATSIRLRSRHFVTWSPRNPTMSGTWHAPLVTGRDLHDARERRKSDSPMQWVVDFCLSADDAERFSTFTRQNIGNKMAVVLDHEVRMAPEIRNEIRDNGFIEGNFTEES